jgi:hypothetical protein
MAHDGVAERAVGAAVVVNLGGDAELAHVVATAEPARLQGAKLLEQLAPALAEGSEAHDAGGDQLPVAAAGDDEPIGFAAAAGAPTDDGELLGVAVLDLHPGAGAAGAGLVARVAALGDYALEAVRARGGGEVLGGGAERPRRAPRGPLERELIEQPAALAVGAFAREHRGWSGGRERVVAERPEGVVRAAQHLARDRQRGAVGAESLFDEISWRRHHRYLTSVADHATGAIVWCRPGRNSGTLSEFFAELGDRKHSIRAVSSDLSGEYQRAIREAVPNAEICFDPWHVCRLASCVTDQVRRDEWNAHERSHTTTGRWVKGTRWSLLNRGARA